MGVQTRLPETRSGEVVVLGPLGGRGEPAVEPAEPQEPQGQAVGVEKVAVVEVDASVPAWRWEVPGLAEPVPVR